jgi:hypothetical protein
MSRNGYFFITCPTPRRGCVPARPGKANVVARKARDPAITSGASPTSVSFHAQDAITDEHRTHASAA